MRYKKEEIKMKDEKEVLRNDFKKRLYIFTLKLIEFIDKLPNDNVSKRIGDQLLRSGTSIIANFVEGQCASSKKDFTNFFNHSYKSNNESKLWFALLRDSKRVKPESVEWFLKELDEYSKIFGSSLLTLRGKK
ncbi:MAG TPA: four helix bundle protein [Candidatus Moranbacteria bacterium]|nr:four helix bundle protein [Candidatus Moranbacteria bacterium]HBU25056.1 four helix bundle protein [Candidatus Moranbacteria bacterium]